MALFDAFICRGCTKYELEMNYKKVRRARRNHVKGDMVRGVVHHEGKNIIDYHIFKEDDGKTAVVQIIVEDDKGNAETITRRIPL